MKLFVILVVSLVLFEGGACLQRYDSNEAWRLLGQHNAMRRKEAFEEGVDFMLETQWDSELEKQADIYASNCDYVEPTQKYPKYELNFGFGDHTGDLPKLYNTWYNNKHYYNFNTMRCASKDPFHCAQYLNIVGQNTWKMGCGRALCSEVRDLVDSPKDKYYFICLYSSHATNSNRGDPYFNLPYNKRPDCMHCDQNYWHFNKGLCAKI